ncbi:MAG: hypothetical protein AAFQ82_19555, partial [Myxococcota bacterium]
MTTALPRWLLLTALVFAPTAAPAQSVSERTEQKPLYRSEPWPGGTSLRGTLGIHRLETAAPLPA